MSRPTPGHAITMRVAAPAGFSATSELTAAAAAAGAEITALDMIESTHQSVVVDITCNTSDEEHASRVSAAVDALDGVQVRKVSDRTFLMHLGGKLSVEPKVELRTRDDLSRAYTPGVARVCLAIAANPADARRLTIKRNTVAVVTDGTAVLGLGNIGAAAALPVMEGKAALFKRFAGVDAWPVCLDTTDTEEIISIVKALAPVYGGVNLEEIAAPRCFEIERRLRDELDIPVFHDVQHGTAIVVLAALINALRVVGKTMTDVKIVVSGAGAAGHAIIRLLHAQGAGHIIACDRSGSLHRGGRYADEHRQWIADHTNPDAFAGSLHDALVGADVFIGVSAPNLLQAEHVATMADGAVVLALANPDPEIHPMDAAKHATVVATGRSDFPNQINNVLAFPGLFRGLLDA
nr:NAD-dependent malic enzyme [Propionibacteriaceae bacterium]